MDEEEQQNFEKQIGIEPSPDGQTLVATEEQAPPTSKPSHKKFIIGIIAVFLLIAGSAGTYFYLNQGDEGPIACTADAKICPDGSAVGRTGPSCEFAECPVNISEKLLSDKFVKYELERYPGDFEFSEPEYYDNQLVAFDIDGRRTVLVESAKSAVPKLNEQFNKTLKAIYLPSNGDRLLFGVIYSESDSGVSDLYYYYVNSGEFVKPNEIEKYFPQAYRADSPSVSSNGRFILSDMGFNTVLILDLLNDKSHIIAQLTHGETLAGSCYGLFGSPTSIRWVNDNTVEYEVYEDVDCMVLGTNGGDLIEIRTIDVSSFVSSTDTSTWKTYRNEEFGFEFQYPEKWSVLNQLDNAYGVDFWSEEGNTAAKIMSVNAGIDFSVIGVSYCGAYPRDERCEVLKTIGGNSVTIDWGVSGQASAMIDSQDGTYGVSFILHNINSDAKAIFRKIISTFKFVES